MPRIDEFKKHHWARVPLGLVAALIVVLLSSTAVAQMWQHRNPDRLYQFRDLRARQIGDSLTVVVSEATGVDSRDRRSMQKGNQTGAAMNTSASDGELGFGVNAAWDNSANRQFSGDSAFSSERSFNDRFTVSVVDVLPNGNLLVQGRRHIGVEGDSRVLNISGIVRHEDVRPDNTVLSRHISSLQLSYEGSGDSTRFTRQGWLMRGISRIWPF